MERGGKGWVRVGKGGEGKGVEKGKEKEKDVRTKTAK